MAFVLLQKKQHCFCIVTTSTTWLLFCSGINHMAVKTDNSWRGCVNLHTPGSLLQFDWKAMDWCDSLFVPLRTDKLGWVSKPYVTHLLDGFSDSVWPQLYQSDLTISYNYTITQFDDQLQLWDEQACLVYPAFQWGRRAATLKLNNESMQVKSSSTSSRSGVRRLTF